MTDRRELAVWLYLVNASLLAAHEMDSAYWHEWDLFQLPGGIQLFLVLNVLILLIVLYGLKQVARWRRGAKALSYLLAAAGVFAFTIHSYFIATGHPEFRLAVSQALLVTMLLVSVAQAVVVRRCDTPQ